MIAVFCLSRSCCFLSGEKVSMTTARKGDGYIDIPTSSGLLNRGNVRKTQRRSPQAQPNP
jgi:hypothetical protein